MSFATNEIWSIIASAACEKDCSCTDACFDEEKSKTFHIFNLTTSIQVTDNKIEYQGYDARDVVTLVDQNNTQKASAIDFRFFSVHKSDKENALTDEGFDGYIGLLPDVD